MLPPGLILLAAWLLFAGLVCELADRKGRERVPWFVLAVLISPLIALALVVALPDPRHQCPACGTRCPNGATACRGCGRDLPARAVPAVAVSPRPAVPRAPAAPLGRPLTIFISVAIGLAVAGLGAASWLVVTA